jgi:hypothetical protein
MNPDKCLSRPTSAGCRESELNRRIKADQLLVPWTNQRNEVFQKTFPQNQKQKKQLCGCILRKARLK